MVLLAKSAFTPTDEKPYLPSASKEKFNDSMSDSCVVTIVAVADAS